LDSKHMLLLYYNEHIRKNTNEPTLVNNKKRYFKKKREKRFCKKKTYALHVTPIEVSHISRSNKTVKDNIIEKKKREKRLKRAKKKGVFI